MVTASVRLRSRRRGLTIVEVGVAVVVLMAAMTLIAQVLLATARTRREIQRQQIASLELGNAMERLARWPADQADESAIQGLKLSDDAAARLPMAKLSGSATPTSDGGKRIVLKLTWDGGAARLASWRYGPVLDANANANANAARKEERQP